MAVTMMGSGHGRGKPVNIEYNLVPFIDLLSCCIAFLLMTAVWIQVSMLQTNEGTSNTPSGKEDFTLALYLFKDRQDISLGEGRVIRIPKTSEGYNFNRLFAELINIKRTYPKKADILVLSQDKILYKDLVTSMDKAIEANFPNITVSGMLE